MNKQQLIASVAETTGRSKSSVEEVLNAAFDAIRDAVAEGERVDLTGLLTIRVKDRPARMGRNPQTGEAVSIPARRAVSIKAGAKLVASANR